MYCTKCGAKLPRDARFCMNCGKPVAAIAPSKVVEPTGAPAKAAVPSKVVEPTAAPAKVPESTGASAKEGAPAKAAAPAASFEEVAAPAAPSAKAVVSTFASEAADSGRNDVSSSDASSNGSSQNDSVRLGSLQSDSSLESDAFADEPEKSCEAGACGASSALQEDVSPKRPETLRGAVNATKHRSRRRVPMVVLAMALAAGTAYAA